MKTGLYYFIGVILLISIYSCDSNNNYIVPFNSEKAYEEAAKNGLTQEESDKISESIYDSIITNTVGKSFPSIKVTNLTNKETNLADELKDYSIIVSSDLYCGYGKECLMNTFPNSLKKIKNKKIHTICLIKNNETSLEDSIIFKQQIEKLNTLYSSVYYINEKEADKLNLYNNPSRLYINNQKTVCYIAVGLPMIGDLYDEIRLNVK
jgi:hypothetical protein